MPRPSRCQRGPEPRRRGQGAALSASLLLRMLKHAQRKRHVAMRALVARRQRRPDASRRCGGPLGRRGRSSSVEAARVGHGVLRGDVVGVEHRALPRQPGRGRGKAGVYVDAELLRDRAALGPGRTHVATAGLSASDAEGMVQGEPTATGPPAC